jgi:hypothetical protein
VPVTLCRVEGLDVMVPEEEVRVKDPPLGVAIAVLGFNVWRAGQPAEEKNSSHYGIKVSYNERVLLFLFRDADR